MQSKVYILLGMFCSGNSFLSEAFIEQGVDIERSFKRCSKTKRARVENFGFRKLNDEIFETAKGSWKDLPSKYDLGQAGRTYTVKKKIKEVISRKNSCAWGWEDPRTCLTLPYFLEQFENEEIYLISVFRRPSLVVRELKQQYGVPLKKGKELNCKYNQSLINSINSFLDLDFG